MTFVEGMLDLVPTARVAHIGLYREPETFVAVEYFFKAPADFAERLVIVVAPVIATANTAVAAIDRLKERGAKDIRLVCLLGAPQGFERLRGLHPDVGDLDRRHRRDARRARLHRARPRRRRRPRLRHAVTGPFRNSSCRGSTCYIRPMAQVSTDPARGMVEGAEMARR